MRALHAWFRTPLGRTLVEAECRLLTRRLAPVYARHVLQIGAFGRGQRPALFGGARQWLVDDWPEGPVDVSLDPRELPFRSESMDVVILIHQLEFSDDPHQVLREAERVLSPEGHLIVLGFNPMSLWGVRRIANGRHGGPPPWNGRYFSRGRIEDWLRLLGLEIQRREGLLFHPPVNSRSLLQRLQGLERLGHRYCRWLGGVHLTMGQKHVAGLTPLRPAWRPRLAVIPGGLAEPSSRITSSRSTLHVAGRDIHRRGLSWQPGARRLGSIAAHRKQGAGAAWR